jgi:hypothetical protein
LIERVINAAITLHLQLPLQQNLAKCVRDGYPPPAWPPADRPYYFLHITDTACYVWLLFVESAGTSAAKAESPNVCEMASLSQPTPLHGHLQIDHPAFS